MRKVSLNGIWTRKIGCGAESEQIVPFSALAVGRSTLKREFTAEGFVRLFLALDGITYHASVYLNGILLGEMLPYCEYEFEIGSYVKEGTNELTVELEDLDLSFGPTPGWENFGGIIRDVSLIYRDDDYISDVFFYSTLKNEYRDASVTFDVKTDRGAGKRIKAELFDAEGICVLSCLRDGDGRIESELKGIKLWSPDDPYLYTLSVTLYDGDSAVDVYAQKVGFREFSCDRHRFLLNGKHIFLKGVCKHEMIGDSGHTVTPEQIEEDMRMIKATGSNFVRLVHYPHRRETVEIADRLGLMVSEEPGLWWSDTSDEEVARGSLEVLERTILRDRSHPSIVFWLAFNECKFTEKFLADSASVCRRLDPTRPVSGANCMSDEDTLVHFNKCGFDFYTMHPYSPSFDRAKRSAQTLCDKPLLFTEWGGHYVYDNPGYMRDCIRKMAELYHGASDECALAGAILWCWADYNDFNRGAPCVDGELFEGIVTTDRKKHLCYDTFCEEIARIEQAPVSSEYEYLQLCEASGEALTLISGGASFSDALSDTANEVRALPFRLQRHRRLKVGPVLLREEIPGISLTPAVLGDRDTLVYSCNKRAKEITLIGLTSINKGYPIGGVLGEEVARVKIFCSGSVKEILLRNGREMTTVFSTIASSRIEPVADLSMRFAEFSYDKNFEKYVINKLTIPLCEEDLIDRVEISSLSHGYALLMYGVFSD
ncbi:MAG: hypothetical protein J6D45_06065 [Clostridia bacterium]|nr:hypothetical protein [Clostridia bacterium]